ncbi:lipase [Xenorhabdus beddingii]|uniref:Lipase n=1 Tax=Xenorhabdus beddingii TaxID=40578 RepID=A0A1Y2SP47_9GAMM|nr:SGNH/GDSL hydrolase family protein [Xenorhabdus beddingii]OTA19950.1 lipase [Xenorhabdus beddingii]
MSDLTRIVALEQGVGVKLYDSINNKSGFYVNTVGNTIGQILTAPDTVITYFPVVPGQTYEINCQDFRGHCFAITLKENDQLTGKVLGLVTLTGTGNTRFFTVADDSTAAFAFMNVVIPSDLFDISSTVFVKVDSVRHIERIPIIDSDVRKSIEKLSSPLKSQKWVVIGDSITEHNFRTKKNYQDYVSESVGGMTVYNYGISATGYYDRYDVANTIIQSPDFLTVFFGTNDWGQVKNTKVLGKFLDMGTSTISGCINTCLLGLIKKFYQKRIAVFTPLPREDNWGSNAVPNAVGYTLEQLANMIKRYADHYSLPCLDLYHKSNLPVYTTEGNEFYFTASCCSAPDGLHPNDAGHRVLAAKIQKFLELI